MCMTNTIVSWGSSQRSRSHKDTFDVSFDVAGNQTSGVGEADNQEKNALDSIAAKRQRDLTASAIDGTQKVQESNLCLWPGSLGQVGKANKEVLILMMPGNRL